MRMTLTLFAVALAAFSAASASETRYGSWQATENGDLSEASTTSDTGARFGLLCVRSKNNCVYYLTAPAICKEGQAYPVLANVASGASELTATCHLLGTGQSLTHALVLTPIDLVPPLVANTGIIGFAMPMVGGRFNVYRFNLDGSSPAIAQVTTYASKPTGDQQM